MERLQIALRRYNKQLKLALLGKIKKSISYGSKKDEGTISVVGKKQRVYHQTANHIIKKLTKRSEVSLNRG